MPRPYAILNVPSDENRADSPFVLRSQRGKYYALTRNRPKPHLMFGVGLYGEGLKCLPGWFSDQSGELVQPRLISRPKPIRPFPP